MNGSTGRNLGVAQLMQMGLWCSSCNVGRVVHVDDPTTATCPRCRKHASVQALPAEPERISYGPEFKPLTEEQKRLKGWR